MINKNNLISNSGVDTLIKCYNLGNIKNIKARSCLINAVEVLKYQDRLGIVMYKEDGEISDDYHNLYTNLLDYKKLSKSVFGDGVSMYNVLMIYEILNYDLVSDYVELTGVSIASIKNIIQNISKKFNSKVLYIENDTLILSDELLDDIENLVEIVCKITNKYEI